MFPNRKVLFSLMSQAFLNLMPINTVLSFMKLNFYLLAHMNCRKMNNCDILYLKITYFKYIWSQLFLSPIPPIFLFSTIPFSQVSHASLCIICDSVTQHVSSFSYPTQYSLSLKYCLFVSVNLWSFFFSQVKSFLPGFQSLPIYPRILSLSSVTDFLNLLC